MKKNLMGLILMVLFFSVSVFSQTTEFTYQGDLQNSSAPANGSFDFEFLLFNAETGGVQAGSTLTRSGVTVTNGIFSVKLDFGANFPGANRFLEIHVKPAGGGAFTPLIPRQAVTSAPYSVTSLNAAIAGNVSGVVSIANGGTGSSIQNFVDLTSNQNMVGDKTFSNTLSGGVVNAATQYNIGGEHVFSIAGNQNLFAGVGAGQANTTGYLNSFFGKSSGLSNTTGAANSFFGSSSGNSNTGGESNSFFGSLSGISNTGGNSNSFFGAASGYSNTTGGSNSFFGGSSGLFNTTGILNSFFGQNSGLNATTGNSNSFFGESSGLGNTDGSNNTMIGTRTNVGAGNLTNATAIGARAFVTQSNSLVLGSINGVNGAAVGTNVGIGTTAPAAKLDVVGNINTSTQFNIGGNRVLSTGGNANIFAGVNAGAANTTGEYNSFFGESTGSSNTTGVANSFFGWFSGQANTTGDFNSFFGRASGISNTTGGSSSFFGSGSGFSNTTGAANSFFGSSSGASNGTGSSNSFLGYGSGYSNTTGNDNTLIGFEADVGISNLTNAAAIGSRAYVTQSNSLVLGSINGVHFAIADTNVGIGTTAPVARLDIVTTSTNGGDNTATFRAPNLGPNISHLHYGTTGDWYIRSAATLGKVVLQDALGSGNVGIGISSPSDKLHVNGIIRVDILSGPGSTPLCRNASNQISTCSASIRHDNGDAEGVKYREQQTQIEAQQKQIDEQNETIKKQRADLDALKALVCSQNPMALACKPQN